MIGIPYLESLFQNILDNSKVINGRFFICPFAGQELNKGNIAEIIEYAEPKLNGTQKYPVAILLPFKSIGNFQYSGLDNIGNIGWETQELNILFVCNSQVSGQNYPTQSNPATGKSTHTIPQTWHDMKRCATDFLQVLHNIISNPANQALLGTVYISESQNQEILQVTNKANDAVTGVLMKVAIKWNSGCDIEDYNPDCVNGSGSPDLNIFPLTGVTGNVGATGRLVYWRDDQVISSTDTSIITISRDGIWVIATAVGEGECEINADPIMNDEFFPYPVVISGFYVAKIVVPDVVDTHPLHTDI